MSKKEPTDEGNSSSHTLANEGNKRHTTSALASAAEPIILVSWDGPTDPANPKNWSLRRKWQITMMVSAFTFLSPISSSMTAPALQRIASDLHITSSFERNMTLSVFVLAYAFGPFLIGPLSEIHGRAKVLQLCNLVFLAFNLGCGFAKNAGQLIAFRFLAGLGGSAPLVIGGGVLGDCWKPEERGKSIRIYTLLTLLGPTLGPLLGGFITQYSTWRWSFFAITIANGVIQCLAVIFLRETFAPKILGDKAKGLRADTGNPAFQTKWETPNRTVTNIIKVALARPFILLFTQPICQLIALYIAYLYGLMYLMLTTFPLLWQERYHETVSIAGLNYISLAIGYIFGTQSTAKINDMIYKQLTEKYGSGRPEFRLPMLMLGAVLVPAGLFWYGWSAQYQLHWIMPNIGAAIFAAGLKIGFQCMQTYGLDVYTTYAASAAAGAVFVRSLAGFGFPLFAPYLFDRLDYGWGNSLLAFIALAIGLPAPILLWNYGPWLRGRSTYAADLV